MHGRSQRLYHVEAHRKNGELRNILPSYFTFQIVNNQGADQIARMHRLVCAFVVGKQQSEGFSQRSPYDVEDQASWPLSGYTPDSNHSIN